MDDGAFLIIRLIIPLIFGAIAAAIANGKGRSGVGWFFGGFFLGLIGVIIVACLSDLNEEEARRKRDQEEKRRLREQLRQEQMKNDAFRQYATERLDAHDGALGLDTRQTRVLLPSTGTTPRPLLVPGAKPPAPPEEVVDSLAPRAVPLDEEVDEWYYAASDERKGPYSTKEVQQLASAGIIESGTLVWCDRLADWSLASSVPEVAPHLVTS